MAAKIKNGGLVVFSSCSHAGIINVCKDAVQQGQGGPTYVIYITYVTYVRAEGRHAARITWGAGAARVAVSLAARCTRVTVM